MTAKSRIFIIKQQRQENLPLLDTLRLGCRRTQGAPLWKHFHCHLFHLSPFSVLRALDSQRGHQGMFCRQRPSSRARGKTTPDGSGPRRQSQSTSWCAWGGWCWPRLLLWAHLCPSPHLAPPESQRCDRAVILAPILYPEQAQWGDRAGIRSWDSKGSSMLTPRQGEKEEHPVASCPASAAMLAPFPLIPHQQQWKPATGDSQRPHSKRGQGPAPGPQDQRSLLGGQEPTWPFPKERRRYCHPQGLHDRAGRRLGWMLEGLQFLRMVS